MAAELLDSSVITLLDTQPIVTPTTGEGAPGYMKVQFDQISGTVNGANTAGSAYRLARIPTNAKVKRVLINVAGGDTSTTSTLTFDINVAFSDSAYDGTQVALQGAIPDANCSGLTNTVANYTTPNKLFGQVVTANSGGIVNQKDITFNGTNAGNTVAAGAWSYNGPNVPLWEYFGFTNSQGLPQDPGGFFDILAYVSANAHTAQAFTMSIEVDYVE